MCRSIKTLRPPFTDVVTEPDVRASSGMIGTKRSPISGSFIRSLSSRTNAIVVATACLPEPRLTTV